jgi:autotransporter-associated beta strand protein
MKRTSLFRSSLKKTVLAVPAAALMLGAAQAGTTVGLNFQSFYYDSGTTPQTVGHGAGYQTTGFPVTAKAFGVAAYNWYSTDPVGSSDSIVNGSIPILSTDTLFGNTSTVSGKAVGGSNTFAGGLTCFVTAPNTWQSGIGEQVAGWKPETVVPGNDEVTWGYLDSNAGQSPTASVSGLAAKFPHGYVVQTIAAEAGVSSFNDVDITDGTTTSTITYSNSTLFVRGPASDGYDGNGMVGLSAPSAAFTSDTININCQAQTSPHRSTLAGFIITDQPVVSQDPAGGTYTAGSTISLTPVVAALPDGLQYQWRMNGAPIPGATSATYTKAGTTVADSGSYDVVVNNLYGAATSAVANVTIVPPHAARTATWDANTTTSGVQDGSGTWSYTLTNWWSGSFDDYWGNADTAVFGAGGTGAYTVTLGDNITANSVTFNSGYYTITNTASESLTLAGTTGITANANAKLAVPLSTGTNDLVKLGAGALTVSGPLTVSGTTRVLAGTLEVLSRSADGPYVVTNGATLKLGYSTGGGYANTAMALYGDGTAATTGLYLAGGKNYNVSGGLIVSGAPTTIRQYGTGPAGLGIFDINSNPGFSISAAASGSATDPNIQMISRGYGMVVTTAIGTNTATGDLVMNGPLNVGSMGLYKRGNGSMRLNAAALPGNLGLQLKAGAVICGAADCIGANAQLSVSANSTLDLNGFSQTVSNATLAGTLKMAIHKGGSSNNDVLTTTDLGNPLTCGGNLVVTNVGVAPALDDTFTLFRSGATYLSGAFTSVTLPALGDGLGWQDNLLVDGSIKVITGSIPPTITTDLAPTTQYAYAGANVTFTVAATGDPVLHYLWKKNGTTPVGTDSPTLTLPAVTTLSTGDYSVTVTNRYGSAPSQATHLQVVTPGLSAAASIQDGPLAFWPLAESAVPTAFDYWGGHDGTQNGNPTLGVAGPRPPACQGFSADTTAYQFDGANSYIACGTNASLGGATDFTVEAWINTTNTGGSMDVFAQRDQNVYNGEYELEINGNGTVYFYVYGNGFQFQINSPVSARRVNDGRWHHVAATRSGTNGAVYIDGSAAATASGTFVAPLDPTGSLNLGVNARGLNNYFNGQMCNMAIYNHALSASRVAAHASAGVLGTSPLKLNIASGGWVEDSKPAGTPYEGMNLGASWVAASSNAWDPTVYRTGVAQFSSGAQVAVPPDADFNSSVGTICFWMLTPTPPAGRGMMLVDRRTSAGMIIVLDGTPSGGLGIQYTGNPSFTTVGYLIDANWHHVAVTYDQSASGAVTVYVDGLLVGSQANTAAWSWPATQQIELGRSHDTYWQEYNGQMDDFRIYNRVLTAAEITTISTVATSDQLVDTAALKVRYNFGTAAGVGTQLSWPIGVLQGAPVLGSPTSWTPVNTTSPSYPFLPPGGVTNASMFYELKF